MKSLDYWQHKRLYLNLKGEESQTIDVDLGSNLETIRSNYLDMYEGVHGYQNQGGREIPISGQGYTLGKLLDDMECQILLDTGRSKSYISK